ncbi:uncharacterized protein LOC135841971 [Planococcus citri]|uniref:uncharacterized protein LOC135841971 n=1 Tax=Planococcus citri TaxID=170843 RepID=UPI0031F992F5
MAAASYQHQHHSYRPLKIVNRDDDSFMRIKSQLFAKRKSAVELLQETKPLYVKSEIVLDRKQELRRSLRGYQLPNEDEEVTNSSYSNGTPGTKLNNSSPPNYNYAGHNNHSPTNNGNAAVPFPIPKSPRLIPPPPAFRKSTNSLQLQNKLRKLLNADSKENLLETNSMIDECDKNNVTESETVEFHNNSYTSQINPICHKSLPDLSNVHDLSSSIERCDHASYGFTSCSVSSDGVCKKSTHTDCVSLASCKNDYLYASADCCESQNDFNLEDDAVCGQRGDSSQSSPVKSCTSFITPPPLYCDNDESSKNRPVLRSKSDVGARTLSSLQLTNLPLYDSSNLNMFFDNLGLESDEYNSLTAPRSNASSPVYFDSDSSVISTSECASEGEKPSTSHTAGLPSIVERNARIIKWLCTCRKALEQIPRSNVPQSR